MVIILKFFSFSLKIFANFFFKLSGALTKDENLIIFTKNKLKKITEIYTLPKTAGTYEAKKIGSLNTQSIITAADYDSKTKLLALTGSRSFKGDEYYILKIEDFRSSVASG